LGLPWLESKRWRRASGLEAYIKLTLPEAIRMPILDIGPVKLASDFKKDLTNSQFFYQVVEHH